MIRQRWKTYLLTKYMFLFIAILVIGVFSTGCTSSSSKSSDPGEHNIDQETPVEDEPNGKVTPPEGQIDREPPANRDRIVLRFLDMSGMTESVYQAEIAPLWARKFPHVQIQYEQYPEGEEIKTYFAANEVPNIIYAPLVDMDLLVAMNVLGNIPGQFLPSQLHPSSLLNRSESAHDVPIAVGAEVVGTSGQHYGLMKKFENGALYYNIDLFDKFGIDYPWEGMIWGETLEMARKLTREEGGVFYQGFQSNYAYLLDRHSVVIPYYDTVKNQSNLGQAEWTQWLGILTSLYNIMGNELREDETMTDTINRFISEQTIAMWAGPYIFPQIPKNTLHWSLVSLPHMDARVETDDVESWSGSFYGIGNTQSYEEESTAAIASLFTEPVANLIGNEEIKQEFRKVLFGLIDANTAIRQAEELIDKNRKKDSP